MADLAYLRRRFERQLTQTATRRRPAGVVSDGAGGRRPAPGGDQVASYKASIRSASGGRDAAGELIRERGAFRIRLPHAADVVAGDQLEINGRAYTVRWAPAPSTDAMSRTVGADELKPKGASI